MVNIPERFEWAADIMDIHPEDNILEIGCGTGILAGIIAGRLEEGKIIALDRSAPMIAKAAKKNSSFIDSGRMELVTASFGKAVLKNANFDSIAAFNVNFFWKESQEEFSLINKLLKPGGKLYVFHQAPYTIDKTAAASLIANLRANGLASENVSFKKLLPTPALCVCAVRNKFRENRCKTVINL